MRTSPQQLLATKIGCDQLAKIRWLERHALKLLEPQKECGRQTNVRLTAIVALQGAVSQAFFIVR